MKILLGNTGRGGEQCIFTSIVHAYRTSFSNAHIEVATCRQYEKLWFNNKDINKWTPIIFDSTEEDSGDPIGAYNLYMETNKDNFDIMEFPCECQTVFVKNDEPKTTLYKCYKAIKNKYFKIDAIERKTFIYPTEEEKKEAKKIADKYPDMILLMHGANSAKYPLTKQAWEKLAKKINIYGDIVYTGTFGRYHMPEDTNIEGATDLRGISYGTNYELYKYIKLFIGLDSLPAFLLSETKAPMILLRGDPQFLKENTSPIVMGYRKAINTFEFETFGEYEDIIINRIIKKVEELWT